MGRRGGDSQDYFVADKVILLMVVRRVTGIIGNCGKPRVHVATSSDTADAQATSE